MWVRGFGFNLLPIVLRCRKLNLSLGSKVGLTKGRLVYTLYVMPLMRLILSYGISVCAKSKGKLHVARCEQHHLPVCVRRASYSCVQIFFFLELTGRLGYLGINFSKLRRMRYLDFNFNEVPQEIFHRCHSKVGVYNDSLF